MSEADTIRAASSRWLRENEANARDMIRLYGPDQLQWLMGWTDWQINNMLTYLELVGE